MIRVWAIELQGTYLICFVSYYYPVLSKNKSLFGGPAHTRKLTIFNMHMGTAKNVHMVKLVKIPGTRLHYSNTLKFSNSKPSLWVSSTCMNLGNFMEHAEAHKKILSKPHPKPNRRLAILMWMFFPFERAFLRAFAQSEMMKCPAWIV